MNNKRKKREKWVSFTLFRERGGGNYSRKFPLPSWAPVAHAYNPSYFGRLRLGRSRFKASPGK
jgi:hypothetical protein